MSKLKPIKCGRYKLSFDRTLVMGVLNATPDSFSDGGLFYNHEKAVMHAIQMAKDGADIIDIGGESTRPYSERVSEEEELKRVAQIIESLANEIKIPMSIDTYKPKIAEECLKRGACILNDVTALGDKKMINVVKKYDVPVILMHMKGKPKLMQKNPVYKNAVNEVRQFLQKRANFARKAGIKDIMIDPGIGFGKKLSHNLQILRNLEKFSSLGYPVVIGTSRKSFIGDITGLKVNERLEGTIASVSIAAMKGANIVRVHDVRECRRAVQVADAIKGA